jgi:PEP-CTERM motif-containing protein
MKKLFILVASAAVIALPASGSTVALWTFESAFTNITGSSTSLTGLPADAGFGTAAGVHAGSATWSSPAGNGSLHSFSANNWVNGDYFQFQTSTLGFSGIGVSYDQTSSGTGPGQFNLAYSTDGSSFTTIATAYAVLANASPNPVWNTTTPSPLYTFTYDLTSITALDNKPSVFFRVINNSTTSANGGTVAAGGTDRIDNFHIYSPVPEPSTLAFLVAGFAGLFGLARRKA